VQLPTVAALGNLEGSHVLIRVDFNTPLKEVDGHFKVTDDFRIRAAVPLFENLMGQGAHVVACTHIGRPKGHFEAKYSVVPVRERLNELCPGVELMENLRFDPGEEANDDEFGRMLVKGFDYYVNEAFGVSHRAHASVVAPPQFLRSAAGPNLQEEVTKLTDLLMKPARPFVAVVGGAKVADKLGIIKVLVEKADTVVIGGAMAFTFWRAMGRTIGDSMVDDARVSECAQLLESGKVVVPDDAWALPSDAPFGDGGDLAATLVEHDVPNGMRGLDIGPAAATRFGAVLAQAQTILWNGPMGVFEDPRFSAGTTAVAKAVAASDAVSVVGGGDSTAALNQLRLCDDVSFVSTGGGASLELLEFGDLPGLRALRDSPFAGR
jgi:phosphoglycerate kinase